jgi:hypothetical protein
MPRKNFYIMTSNDGIETMTTNMSDMQRELALRLESIGEAAMIHGRYTVYAISPKNNGENPMDGEPLVAPRIGVTYDKQIGAFSTATRAKSERKKSRKKKQSASIKDDGDETEVSGEHQAE